MTPKSLIDFIFLVLTFSFYLLLISILLIKKTFQILDVETKHDMKLLPCSWIGYVAFLFWSPSTHHHL
jgi:hypothetical protein